MALLHEAPVGDICCVFTDIIDSTNLWENDQSAMRTALVLHNIIIRAQLSHFGGYEVKTLGDGFFVTFAHAERALDFCLATQKLLHATRWPRAIADYVRRRDSESGVPHFLRRRGLQIRMGVHFGRPFSCRVDEMTGRMDYYGSMINLASRMQAEAGGGEIALSDDFIVELHRRRVGETVPVDRLNHLRRVRMIDLDYGLDEFYVGSKGLCSLRGLHAKEHVFLVGLRWWD